MNQSPTSPPPAGSPFPGYPTLDFEGLARVVIKRGWVIAAVFGVCVAAAAVYALFLAPKLYESAAVVYVEPQRERILNENILQVRTDNFESLDALKSLGTEPRFRFGHSPRSRPARSAERSGFSETEKERRAVFGPGTDRIRPRARHRRSPARNPADRHPGTRQVPPRRAQRLAQGFVDEFEALLIEQKFEAARKAKEILEAEAADQLERVNAAEDALQAFREKHSGIQLDEGGIVEQKLSDLDKLLSEAKNKRLGLQAEFEQLQALGGEDPERILEIGDYLDLEHINKLLLARNQKRAEFVKISRQYEPTHQTYIAFISDLEGLNDQVRQVAIAVGESIRKRYGAAVDHEEKLKNSVEEQKREVLAATEIRKEFRSLKHGVDVSYDTYHKLLARINETDVTEGVKESHLRLSEAPLVAERPAKPNKKLIVGLAGFFGLALGFGIVVAWYLLDRSLKTRRQVEQTLGLPVLGEIPAAPDPEDSVSNGSLVVAKEPYSMAAEAFRSLRVSLASLGPRSVMVTSAMPGEGKSFCAVNLALLQAQLGYRTLLIDADFRRPSLGTMLMPPGADANGAGALEAKNLCQKTAFPNIYLISCGRFARNTGEMMNGEHFASMLWEAYLVLRLRDHRQFPARTSSATP